MKFCPYCGTRLENEMLYCNNCGKKFPVLLDQEGNNYYEYRETQSRVNNDPTFPETTKKKGFGRSIIIILLVVVALWMCWNTFKTWAAENNEEQAEINYNNGVELYSKGQYRNALNCFEEAGDSFPDVSTYKILCEGHLYKSLTEVQVSALCKRIDFLDTKSVLLLADEIAVNYFNGYWTSEDGKYYFEVYPEKKTVHSMYNLPADQPENAEYFFIKEGVYYLHTESNEDVEVFRFTILSKDRVMVFCFKDSSRVEMSREK